MNVKFGGMMNIVFSWIKNVSITPELKKDTLISVNEKEMIRVFWRSSGKLDEEIESGFVL
jgi:hypothetical protein